LFAKAYRATERKLTRQLTRFAPMNRTVHHDLLRFQSGLANSSPDKRPGFDQRDCSFLGGAAQSESGGLVGISSGFWTVSAETTLIPASGNQRAAKTSLTSDARLDNEPILVDHQ